MKTYRLFLFSYTLALGLGFSSCIEDEGNYDYRQVNDIAVTGLPADGTFVQRSEPVTIRPVVNFTTPGKPADYTYEWSYVSLDAIAAIADPVCEVFATTPTLENYIFQIKSGDYRIYYTVTDHKNNRTFRASYAMTLISNIYEGFLVMNDIDGKMRLDMISRRDATINFTQLTDVLAISNSALPEQTNPKKVVCYPDQSAPGGYAIWLLADQTNMVHGQTLAYEPSYGISYRMMGAIPAGFSAKAIAATGSFYGGNEAVLLGNNNEVHAYSRTFNESWGMPYNTTDGGLTFYKTSPHIAAGYYGYVIFNEENGSFYKLETMPVYYSSAPPTYSFPGMELRYLEYKQTAGFSSYCYAVLRNPDTKACRVLRFMEDMFSAPTSYANVSATDIGNAELFTASTEFTDYLFYSVGSKVYLYSLSGKTTKEMLDVGAGNTITYLNIPNYLSLPTALAGRYDALRHKLIVASYNPGTKAGTLKLYNVPSASGALVPRADLSWDGFGKIVDVSFLRR